MYYRLSTLIAFLAIALTFLPTSAQADPQGVQAQSIVRVTCLPFQRLPLDMVECPQGPGTVSYQNLMNRHVAVKARVTRGGQNPRWYTKHDYLGFSLKPKQSISIPLNFQTGGGIYQIMWYVDYTPNATEPFGVYGAVRRQFVLVNPAQGQ
jgi:hypothetical protein